MSNGLKGFFMATTELLGKLFKFRTNSRSARELFAIATLVLSGTANSSPQYIPLDYTEEFKDSRAVLMISIRKCETRKMECPPFDAILYEDGRLLLNSRNTGRRKTRLPISEVRHLIDQTQKSHWNKQPTDKPQVDKSREYMNAFIVVRHEGTIVVQPWISAMPKEQHEIVNDFLKVMEKAHKQ